MPGTWFNAGKTQVANHGIDLIADTLKVMLVTSAYTFSAAHAFISDLGAVEIAGTGYTGGFAGAGRKTLTTKTITTDNVNNRSVFDADDVSWTALLAGTIGGIVVAKEITDDAHSKLLAYFAVTPYLTVGVNVNLTWDAGGILWMA